MIDPGKAQGAGREVFEGDVPVTSVRLLGADVAVMTLEAPDVAQRAGAGQFVMVGCGARGEDPLLLRPFALSGVAGDEVEILFQIVGRGTRLLAAAKPGDQLRLRGPFGNGFAAPDRGRILLASGGAGVAPMLLTFERFRRQGHDVHLVFGVPGKGWENVAAFVRERVPGVWVFSDDGSLGDKGTPCDALEERWDEVWVCGPQPMMAAFARLLRPEVRFLVSLDSRMGCGYGGCLCCTIPTEGGMRRVCTEGPVFDGREVRWHELVGHGHDEGGCSCA